jgi:anti-sigma regulatory factor (Ser/Thr protein kinase)
VDQPDDLFELHVGADPAGLSTVRVFVRAIARSTGADPERTDDLELIVSEICSELLEAGGRALHLAVRRGDGTLEVSVGGQGASVPTDGEENAFRRDLLRTLAPDTTWEAAGARFTVMAQDAVDGGPPHDR